MTLGVLLMLGLDQFRPHEHTHGGPCGAGSERVGRLWLFVFVIALHNLPEGLAIGVGYASGDTMRAGALATGIAIQDVPEGLVVGEDPVEDARRFRRSDNGVCLITQPMIDRLKA